MPTVPALPTPQEPQEPQPASRTGVRDTATPADRPLSRRELRDRDHHRRAAVPDQRSTAGPAPVVASLSALAATVRSRTAPRGRSADRAPTPSPVGGSAARGSAAGPHPAPGHEELAPHEAYRYTWRHLGALAAVAGALGFLIWSLTTADGSGADGARAADPTTSSSLTATRGEP